MITSKRNYFRYLPETPDLEQWGIWVSASGTATVSPGNSYPPLPHPSDYHFQWKGGRTLEALQIILITSGSGWFETRLAGKKKIGAGTALLLLPGIWHRYRPDTQTGWKESWIEVRGRVIDDLLGSGTLSSLSMVRGGEIVLALEEILDSIHRRVCDKSPTHRPELSADALKAIALLCRNERQDAPGSILRLAVTRAEHYLADHHAEALDMETLARLFGVSYSSFRRVFRSETGLSPWQYLLSVRLNRARRLLSSEGTKLQEVASTVGFSSAFHLSAAFKKTYGLSPDTWRKECRRLTGDSPDRSTKHADPITLDRRCSIRGR